MMMQPSLIERITRSLAYMLRHRPDEFELELDAHGFAELGDVVHALNERLGDPIDEQDVVDAVESGDRERYEVRDGRIRALYGHSIEVDPGSPGKPPGVLYLGVAAPDAARALRFGLRGGRRRFLHLALTPDDAIEGGRRMARDYTILEIRALEAWEEGINFYDRRALYLADPIPTEFIEVLEERHDGEPPAARGPRAEESDGRGERPRGRGRDRDRGQGRDGGRDREEVQRGGERRASPAPAARARRVERVERTPRVEASRQVERLEQAERAAPAEVVVESRPPARSLEERPRVRREESRAPEATPSSRPAPTSGGFGLGVFEDSARRPERAPRPEQPEQPEQLAPEPEPSPRPAPQAPLEAEQDTFGAGLL